MAQEAINRSVIDSNNLTQQQQGSNIDPRQQQQQQVLQQHFTNDTTANPQHQQQNTAAGLAAAVAATTNGPTTVIGNPSSGSNIGSVSSALCSTGLTNPSGQQPVGANTSVIGGVSKQQQVQQQQQQQPTNEAHIPPLLGVAPLGPSPLHKDHQLQFQMMEAAYYHLPTPSDSEKLTTYFHRTPVQTPPHYPQVRREMENFAYLFSKYSYIQIYLSKYVPLHLVFTFA